MMLAGSSATEFIFPDPGGNSRATNHTCFLVQNRNSTVELFIARRRTNLDVRTAAEGHVVVPHVTHSRRIKPTSFTTARITDTNNKHFGKRAKKTTRTNATRARASKIRENPRQMQVSAINASN